MTTASTATQLAPQREVSLARFGAASHRTFKASSGEVEVNGEKHPKISTNVTVATAAIGAEVTFYGLKSSMTAFHPASNTFITVERLNVVPNVPEKLKVLLHEDAFWKDPRSQVFRTVFQRIVAKNMKCLKSEFSTPLSTTIPDETELAQLKANPEEYQQRKDEAIKADILKARDYMDVNLRKHMDRFAEIVAEELVAYATPWRVR